MFQVFISYAREDSAFVDRLQADIESRLPGVACWVDRSKILAGDVWQRMIEQEITRCDAFLVVLSPEALLRSTWVRKEIDFALSRGKRIVPLMAHTVALPMSIINVHVVSFESGSSDSSTSYEQGLEQLLRGLSALLPTPVISPMVAAAAPSSLPKEPTSQSAEPASQAAQVDDLYRIGVQAYARQDYEATARSWQAALAADPSYLRGDLQARYDELMNKVVQPARIERLRVQARTARDTGEWRVAVGAWSALHDLLPDDAEARQGLADSLEQRAIEAGAAGDWSGAISAWEALLGLTRWHRLAQEQLALARENQQYATLYANAARFVAEGDLAAARLQLTDLARLAPQYGDPQHLTAVVGLPTPEPYTRFVHVKRNELLNKDFEAQWRRMEEEAAQWTADIARKRKRVRALGLEWGALSLGAAGLVLGAVIGVALLGAHGPHLLTWTSLWEPLKCGGMLALFLGFAGGLTGVVVQENVNDEVAPFVGYSAVTCLVAGLVSACVAMPFLSGVGVSLTSATPYDTIRFIVAAIGLLLGLVLGWSPGSADSEGNGGCLSSIFGGVFGAALGAGAFWWIVSYGIADYLAITRGWLWLLLIFGALSGTVGLLICGWMLMLQARTGDAVVSEVGDTGMFTLGTAGGFIGLLGGSVIGCALTFGPHALLPTSLGALAGMVALGGGGGVVGWLLGAWLASW